MEDDPNRPESLPRAYAAWRRRILIGAIVATAVGFALHGPEGEVRFDYEADQQSPRVMLGIVALVVAAIGPGLAGTCLALAAIRSWRRLGRSSRLTRTAWLLWVLGPLPVLLLPLDQLFGLAPEDALRTSANQIRHLLVVTAPALFALLPGILRSALVLERFLPESRAPGQIALLAAPACAVAYLLPLAALTQLAFHRGLYLGLLLLAASPLVPLLASRRLLRRDSKATAARLVRSIVAIQGVLGLIGLALVARWLGDHPLTRALLGHVDAPWVAGLAARVLAGKWLTTVVVTDLLLSLLHQGRESARSLADTPEGEALARKLDALGDALRPGEPSAN